MRTSSGNIGWILFCFLAVCCGQKSNNHDMHHGGEAANQDDPNKALYDEVMGVHNEVMPKLDDIFKIKEALKDKIAHTPDMAEARKKDIEVTIVQLDAAGEGMMVWMRQFDPLPDSTGADEAKKYLESEMVKVKQVKEDMLKAIEKGNALK